VNRARSQVTAEDGRVRVTSWTFEAAGDATGQHVHEYDYVVVPVTGARSWSPARTGPSTR
jgi:beta-alanine degradation protein BauB